MATCLYKDKPCTHCGVMIKVGEECAYESESKTVAHWKCLEPLQPPGPDAYALADSLGYRQISWEEILRVLEKSQE